MILFSKFGILFLTVSMLGAVPDAGAQIRADTYRTLKNQEVVIHFPASLQAGAQDVIKVFPVIKNELEALFGWPIQFRPSIILVEERNRFRRLAGDDRVEAFARPHDRVIVIDYSRLAARPLRMITTLKHELVHLLLHDQIVYVSVPKWLNEGIAQWASGGLAEILVTARKSLIGDALRAGRLPALQALEHRFPADRNGFSLAYEQSLSIVNYIEKNYGRQAVLNLLGYMQNGVPLDQAVYESLAVSLAELENTWRSGIRRQESWLTFLSIHITEFLFLLGAGLTLTGFLRYWIKKKNYRDDPEDDDWE